MSKERCSWRDTRYGGCGSKVILPVELVRKSGSEMRMRIQDGCTCVLRAMSS